MSESSSLLTVDQFADRLQVSRTTVFSWIKSGCLREGTHYFRLGRVLRFHWPLAAVIAPAVTPDHVMPPRSPKGKKPKAIRGSSSGINLDY